MVEVFAGNALQVVSPTGRVQEIRSHHGVKDYPFEFNSRALQHKPVILDVLAHLGQVRVFKERFQLCKRLLRIHLCARFCASVAQWNINRFIGPAGKGNTHN